MSEKSGYNWLSGFSWFSGFFWFIGFYGLPDFHWRIIGKSVFFCSALTDFFLGQSTVSGVTYYNTSYAINW